MRDLLVTGHTPVSWSGRGLRTYGIARALAAHRELDILYVRFGADRPDRAFAAIDGVELHSVSPSRGFKRALRFARARYAGVPTGLARGISDELVRAAVARSSERDRGRVIADGPTVAAALAALSRSTPVIYNAHNLESGFRGRIGDRGMGKAKQLRDFERRLLANASESWMVSPADIAAANLLCPTARLRYVPNVVDAAAITPVGANLGAQRAVFVASFTYEPNRRALDFLLEEVFPTIWRQMPQAKLALVGAGLEHFRAPDARVERLGFVKDLASVYTAASCALVPLLDGGGSPLKLIEALAFALPVITTSHAAKPLELTNGVDCLIANASDAFAQAIVEVMRGTAPEIADRGRDLVLARYSIEALSELLAP